MRTTKPSPTSPKPSEQTPEQQDAKSPLKGMSFDEGEAALTPDPFEGAKIGADLYRSQKLDMTNVFFEDVSDEAAFKKHLHASYASSTRLGDLPWQVTIHYTLRDRYRDRDGNPDPTSFDATKLAGASTFTQFEGDYWAFGDTYKTDAPTVGDIE